MSRLILIVNKEDLNDKPAETLIGTLITKDGKVIKTESDGGIFSSSKEKNKNDKEGDSEIYRRIGISVASLILPLPAAIVVNAAPAVYSLYQYLTSKNDNTIPTEQLMNSAASFDSYLKKISITPESAKDKGYHFQPGHPQVNRAYILHPLSDYNENKNHHYIPSDSLDEFLLQERESEMIRLFVMLGATRIEFRKEGSKNKSNKVNASLQATSVRISADAEVSSNSTSGSVNYDNRIIKLSGRRWEKDSKLDTSSFSWLPFEPSWESIVFAREHGGCISAELELKKKTAFSSSSEGKLGVDIEVFKTSVGVNTSSGDEEDVNYNVYVEFTEVIQ